MEVKQKVYNPTFAIMKGIAIISVVVGYCTLSKEVEAYVNQYHLAAFFFVAGYFLTDKYVFNPIQLIKKRINSLYIPFVVSCLACVLLHNLLCEFYVYSTPLSLREMLIGGSNVLFRLFSSEPLMGAMWFCPTLLFASVIAGLTLWAGTKFENRRICMTLLFMLLVISVAEIAMKVFHLKSPYSIWQNMVISGILFEGWLFRIFIEKYLLQIRKFILFFMGSTVALVLYFLVNSGYLFNLQVAHLKEIPAFYLLVVTFFASLMVYAFATSLKTTFIGKAIAVVGDHSFSIMMLHFLAFKLVSLLICIVKDVPLTEISSFPTIPYENIGWLFAYTFVGCALPIAAVMLKDKLLNLCVR